MSKRQRNIFDFFGQATKQRRKDPQNPTEEKTENNSRGVAAVGDANTEDDKLELGDGDGNSSDENMEKGSETGELPTFWTAEQFKINQTSHPWLIRNGRNFGCATCSQVGSLGPEKAIGMKIAKEWVTGTVCSNASDEKRRQRANAKKGG